MAFNDLLHARADHPVTAAFFISSEKIFSSAWRFLSVACCFPRWRPSQAPPQNAKGVKRYATNKQPIITAKSSCEAAFWLCLDLFSHPTAGKGPDPC
jgi:hypothetical protein